VLITSTQN